MLENWNKGLAASVLGASILLTACGGGGSGGGSSSSGGAEPSSYSGVEGPLDAVQEPLSNQVFSQLSGATAGTPIAGAVDCLDQVVVEDVIDVLDSLVAVVDPASLSDPEAAFMLATTNAQAAAGELFNDLPNLLASLVGASDCSGSGGQVSGNPLAGTPLADLGSAFESIFANGGGGDGSPLDLHQLADLLEMLSEAVADNVPAEVAEAPVLGGALTTLEMAFSDLAFTVNAVLDQDSNASAEGVSSTLDNLLTNVLTNVLPVRFIEEQAGQEGLFTAPIESGLAQVTGQVDSGLASALLPLFDGLQTLVSAINDGLAGNLGGSGGGAGPTGTPLDAILAPLTQLGSTLGAGGGGDGLTGTPLDLLLNPIVGAIEGGGAGACPLSGTPLNPVCDVVETLLGTLSGNANADPVSALLGLVNNLVSSLIPG